MSKKHPAWVQISKDGKSYEKHETLAPAFKEACLLSIAGVGITEIKRRIPALSESTLTTQFHSRSLVGERTPQQRKDGKRVNAAAPIPDYFPALLTEDEWGRLQAALDSRANHVKSKPARTVNLFPGLLFTVENKPLICGQAGGKDLYLAKGKQGKSVLRTTVETMVLRLLTAAPDNGPADETAKQKVELEACIARTEKELAEAQKAYDEIGSTYLLPMVAAKGAKLDKLRLDLEDVKRSAAVKTAHNLSTIRTMAEQIQGKTGADLRAARQRLAAAIRTVVERVTIRVSSRTECVGAVQLRNGQLLACGPVVTAAPPVNAVA